MVLERGAANDSEAQAAKCLTEFVEHRERSTDHVFVFVHHLIQQVNLCKPKTKSDSFHMYYMEKVYHKS